MESLTLPTEILKPGFYFFKAVIEEYHKFLPYLRTLLSQIEIKRAGQLATPELKESFVVSRGLLRAVLGSHLNLDPKTLRLIYGTHGKPELLGRSEVHFNLSHSKGVVAVIWSEKCPVGVDVELVRSIPTLDAIARRYFSEKEVRSLFSFLGKEREVEFFKLWTLKEAILKSQGLGISQLKSTSVDPGYEITLLDLPKGYVGTAVWDGKHL